MRRGKKMVEIVHRQWIDRDKHDTKKGVCYFPPAHDYRKVEKWLKNETKRKSSWEPFDVEILYSAGDLESARRRLQRLYKKRSDIESPNSDSDGIQEPHISKKCAALMLNLSTPLQSVPEVNEESTCDVAHSSPSTSVEIVTTEKSFRSLPSKVMNNAQTRREKKTELQNRLQTLREQGNEDFSMGRLMDYLDTKFEIMTFTIQDEIQNTRRAQQYDLGKRLDELKGSISIQTSNHDVGPSAKSSLGVELPISSLEEFLTFEKMLDPKADKNLGNPAAALEKQELLKRVMKTFARGTKECDKSVNAIMQELFKKAVQQHYSGFGSRVNGVAKKTSVPRSHLHA
ncbi:uncharacterized protein LOC135171195 [Diachasmimorpha longicaudata]|uniref:uncharacterized protein LOC135171195 n=1 Tax=Diachasmimorpha longicaudata TaxID=58733 RepID=UPI0030B90C21